MIPWEWSAFLTIVGVTGMYFVGQKKRFGFLINLVNQVFWLTYAIVTQQWGFIPASLLWGIVFFRNYVAWGRK